MISLTEEQLENLLQAAKHGQARRLETLQLIEKLLNDIDADMTADLDNGYYDLVEVDDDVFDILNLSEINKDSALRYLREFILYWKDKGSAFTTWNSKFIEHVKRRHMMSNEIGNDEENKKYSEPGKYKKDFKTRKNDNTWAKEINLD